MFFTSNISYILNAAANIFKGCGIFDLIFLLNMLLLLLTAANMFMSQIQAIFSTALVNIFWTQNYKNYSVTA